LQFAYNYQIEHPVGVFLWKRLHFPILKKGFITMSAIILGHKHPDTDSIVSAIASAASTSRLLPRERRLRKPPSCLSVSACKRLKS